MVTNNNAISYTEKRACAGTTEDLTNLHFLTGSPPGGLMGEAQSSQTSELSKDRVSAADRPYFSGRNKQFLKAKLSTSGAQIEASQNTRTQWPNACLMDAS